MKRGETACLKVDLDISLDLVAKIIFALNNENTETDVPTLKKEYPSATTVVDGIIYIPLNQAETMLFGKVVRLEGQIEFKDKSVVKTDIVTFSFADTIYTEVVSGNTPNVGQPNCIPMTIDGATYINISLDTMKSNLERSETAANLAVSSASKAQSSQALSEKYKNWAADSSNSAYSSEITAQEHALSAKNSSDSALASKTSAETAATASNNSAIKAAESAQAASTSETNAAQSAANAAASVAIIGTAETIATNVAAAAHSAASAEVSATNAGLAKTAAETARAGAESAKETSVTASETATVKAAAAATSEINAKASETSASNSKISAAQALADLLAMLGTDVATLVGGKIPLSQIPATATQEIYTITSESELTGLTAQRGDLAELIQDVGGVSTITKTWQCLGDSTVASNWKVWGTSYAVQAGSATTAVTAENANMINNHRLVEIAADNWDSTVKDPDTYYLVY